MSDSVIFTFCFVSLYFENIIFNITSKHFSVFVFQKHFSNIVIQTNFQMWTPQNTFQFSNKQFSNHTTRNTSQKLIQSYIFLCYGPSYVSVT